MSMAGRMVRNARRRENLTQRELAAKAGTAQDEEPQSEWHEHDGRHQQERDDDAHPAGRRRSRRIPARTRAVPVPRRPTAMASHGVRSGGVHDVGSQRAWAPARMLSHATPHPTHTPAAPNGRGRSAMPPRRAIRATMKMPANESSDSPPMTPPSTPSPKAVQASRGGWPLTASSPSSKRATLS